MFRFAKETTAAVLASALTLTTIPYISYAETAVAEEKLLIRDVRCANENVNGWESEHFQFIWGGTELIQQK